MEIVSITGDNESLSPCSRLDIADFLFISLDRYGDKKDDILKCLDYALSKEPGKGGFITLALVDNRIVGAVVLNKTGMSGYIPENILVYIAVDAAQRGQGTGMKLMEHVLASAEGGIALHVDHENPARRLYERLGFEAKYLEMRINKSK